MTVQCLKRRVCISSSGVVLTTFTEEKLRKEREAIRAKYAVLLEGINDHEKEEKDVKVTFNTGRFPQCWARVVNLIFVRSRRRR